MMELNRAQLQAWESSLQLAANALNDERAGFVRLRGRLRNTVSAFRESIESVRRISAALATTQRELANEKARLSAVTDHLPIPYLLTTLDGTILTLNAAASAALNVSARALVGRNVLVFLDDRERWMTLLTEVAMTQAAVRHQGNLRPRERLQESIVASLSLSSTLDHLAIQWFLTGGPADHTLPGGRKTTPRAAGSGARP